MKFENTFLSKQHRYWLGIETETGGHFVSIPVSNRMVDYVEPYRISEEEYNEFLANPAVAIDFVESCRRREQDDRLFMQPGTDRGTPR